MDDLTVGHRSVAFPHKYMFSLAKWSSPSLRIKNDTGSLAGSQWILSGVYSGQYTTLDLGVLSLNSTLDVKITLKRTS